MFSLIFLLEPLWLSWLLNHSFGWQVVCLNSFIHSFIQDLFRRAWCVAEIAEAKRLQMDQSLKLWSKATLQERARTLENLDVRDMRASSEQDKELILGKIQDVDDFNAKLQVLIFDPKSGLVATWNAMDSLQQIGEVGRLIRWGLADAGSGKVWKAWDGHN